MRIRKVFALMGTVTVLGACLLLYTVMDLTLLPQNTGMAGVQSPNKWASFENRLGQLEGDILKNQETVQEIKAAINSLIQQQNGLMERANRAELPPPPAREEAFHPRALVTPPHLSAAAMHYRSEISHVCPASAVNNSDIQMLALYKSLPFDNPDGGVWKQGWNIEYNPQQWTNRKKLRVFLIPHSHNDPGWIKTFEDYYQSQTRAILTNMVQKLGEDERRKFIWAETSYLNLWWIEQEQGTRDQLKKLIENGQLEIVTGGWVMTDEANAHYWSMLHQLTEGHEWLQENIGVKPRYGWAIDPFGHSATMSYLLRGSNFSASLLQRVHYSVKKRLAKDRNLEFRWRQGWGNTEMFTHMMPFYSYDVPHTCGPDPKVCCQFDFKRLPGYGVSCPWRIPPQPITEQNVAARAELLLDQYRKKAQLYRTNALLVPLGDDFRYDHSTEWDAQYNNYQKLFDHMNSRHDLNVEAQFATLSDYFKAVHEEASESSFPSLSGDFFTYADRDDHYWSGYYTSRPYYKRLDRVLLGYLRAAEIIYSIAWGQARRSSRGQPWLLTTKSGLVPLLTEARQAQALFQHHDGVTGTAKDHVMKDYGSKMLRAISAAQHVIQQCTQHLLATQPEAQLDPEFIYFNLDDSRPRPGALSQHTKITFGEGLLTKRVVIYNSLTRPRQEIVRLRVAVHSVKIIDWHGRAVVSQVQPLFDEAASMKDGEYELLFLAEVPALSLSAYTVSWVSPEDRNSASPLASITLANHIGDSTLHRVEGFDDIQTLAPGEDFTLATTDLAAAFTSGGLLKAVTLLRPQPLVVPLHLDFIAYGAREGKERSGAYLFLPDGPAKIVAPGNTPLVRVLSGPLASQVEVQLPFVTHRVAIYNCSGERGASLDIYNLVELLERSNTEIAMRFSTNLKSGEKFYTDLNGFQMVPRQRFSKLPLQAHFYPLSGMAYFEDSAIRVTVASGSPLGVASLKEGQLEIMQDRRLAQDDNRGLNQGVLDNHPTPHVFSLLVERISPGCQKTEGTWPQPSLGAQMSLQSIIHPLIREISVTDPHVKFHPFFSLYQGGEPDSWGCGMHVVNMRTRKAHTRPRVGLVLQQMDWDTCVAPPSALACSAHKSSQIDMNALLPGLFGDSMRRSSLTFLDEGDLIPKSQPQPLCPMELGGFVLGG